MIGVIGLGGCGGNIADEANKLGFLSAAINYSQKDLDANDVKHKLKLVGSEGVGKNRDEGIKLVQDQWEVPMSFIKEHFANTKIILLCFSASGGSGSSVGPILAEILKAEMSDKVICALVVIPDHSEAVVSQINTIKTFEDLSNSNIAIFPIDNQQVKECFNPPSKSKLFELSNRYVVELLLTLVSYTEKSSRNGNFDKTDLKTVLSTPGIGLISALDLSLVGTSSFNQEWITERIQQSWNQTVFVKPDYSKVGRAAVIFDGQESLLEYINHELVFSTFANGMPLDLFEGTYHEHQARLYTVLVGLPWCNKRLQDIERLINVEKVEVAMSSGIHHKSESVGLMDRIRSNSNSPKVPVSEIFKKYKR
nr:hypothetical protein [Mycobacterium sp. E3298]